MVLDICEVSRFVKVNALPPITSSVYFDSQGVPDPKGLFSHELFGLPGSPDRKMRMAYIELDGPYLHPQVYNTLIKLDRKLSNLIAGTDYFIYDPKLKNFVPSKDDVPNAGTGIGFLYEHWNDLYFRKTGAAKRENRLELISLLKREEAFMDKQLVIPAFFRDLPSGRKDKVPVINTLYKRIFNSVSVLKTVGSASFTYNLSRSAIQQTLNDIYTYFMDLLRLKDGFLHAAVMSKSIDYGVRTLISAPTFNANSWKEMPADYEHMAVPLAQCITEYTIGVQTWIENWVNSIVQGRRNMYIYDLQEKKVVLRDLDDRWKEDFSADVIGKKIYEYVMTPEMRFYPVTIRFSDKQYRPFAFINGDRDLVLSTGEIDADKLPYLRYYTWTDLFYIAAVAVAEEKAIYTTRYPVTDHHSQYFSKIRVRSTFKTMEMLIGNKTYSRYPVINLNTPASKIESLFIDSLEIFPCYIDGLGADHDGDQVSCRGLYSYEANKWVDNYITSPTNAIGISGKSARSSGDVGTHTLYNLLRDPVNYSIN